MTAADVDSEMSCPTPAWDLDDADDDHAATGEAGGASHCIAGSVSESKGETGSFFIETYGCQMNVSDSEVVRAILLEAGFREAESLDEAGVVLANTCAIRERAEGKVWDRLKFFSSIR